jgi:hypothetical protein
VLKDKAVQNLTAGEILLDRGLADAAASRLYYATYQAAVHRLTEDGFEPGAILSGAVEWDHSMVLINVRCLRNRWKDRLLYLEMRHFRGQADYGDAGVPAHELVCRRSAISDFVKELAR